MMEKHGPAKETDITAVLVIAFTVLVAVAIAKVAGDFTSKTTSTSSRASAPAPTKPKTKITARAASTQDCANTYGYDMPASAYTVVGLVSSCGKDSSNIEKINAGPIGISKCCISAADYRKSNDNFCSNNSVLYDNSTPQKILGKKTMMCKILTKACVATVRDINNEYKGATFYRMTGNNSWDDVRALCSTADDYGVKKVMGGSCCYK